MAHLHPAVRDELLPGSHADLRCGLSVLGGQGDGIQRFQVHQRPDPPGQRAAGLLVDLAAFSPRGRGDGARDATVVGASGGGDLRRAVRDPPGGGGASGLGAREGRVIDDVGGLGLHALSPLGAPTGGPRRRRPARGGLPRRSRRLLCGRLPEQRRGGGDPVADHDLGWAHASLAQEPGPKRFRRPSVSRFGGVGDPRARGDLRSAASAGRRPASAVETFGQPLRRGRRPAPSTVLG